MRQLPELESILQQLLNEHVKLLRHLENQQLAMKAFDLKAMDEAARQQEASRLRIASLETRRRGMVLQIARLLKVPEKELTLAKLAELHPARAQALLGSRDELKRLIGQISGRTHVVGRLAAAVVGHLNTVMRLLAGAVEQAGIYTRSGVPQVSARIGVMEAVG
jgi:hypothetical protein